MKKIIAAALPLLVLPLLLCACSPGFLPLMGKLAADPVAEVPTVTSFLEELTCQVEWTPDPAADSFVLERAQDEVSPVYETLYAGTAVSYTDTDCTDGTRYLYRLRKIKGDMTFPASAPAFGVGSASCRDYLEPNDTEDSATPLDYDRESNIYCFRTYGGEEIKDVDWYSVTVPPRRTARIIITQEGLSDPANPGSTLNIWMYFYLKGHAAYQPANSDPVSVRNDSYQTKTFYFSIYPNPDDFATSASFAGGRLVAYTVSLASIDSLDF